MLVTGSCFYKTHPLLHSSLYMETASKLHSQIKVNDFFVSRSSLALCVLRSPAPDCKTVHFFNRSLRSLKIEYQFAVSKRGFCSPSRTTLSFPGPHLCFAKLKARTLIELLEQAKFGAPCWSHINYCSSAENPPMPISTKCHSLLSIDWKWCRTWKICLTALQTSMVAWKNCCWKWLLSLAQFVANVLSIIFYLFLLHVYFLTVKISQLQRLIPSFLIWPCSLGCHSCFAVLTLQGTICHPKPLALDDERLFFLAWSSVRISWYQIFHLKPTQIYNLKFLISLTISKDNFCW